MSAQTTSPTSESGFTLIEMVVALFVFATLSVATLTALTSTFRARDNMDTALTRMDRIAVLDTLLRQDMAAITTRPTRDSYGTPELISLQSYAQDGSLLVFTRGGRPNPQALAPRGDIMRVAYALEDGKLIRRTPALPTPAIDTPMGERVLMDGVRRADVTAYSGDQQLLQLSVPADLGIGTAPLPDRIDLAIELDTGRTLGFILKVGS